MDGDGGRRFLLVDGGCVELGVTKFAAAVGTAFVDFFQPQE